uniref:Mesencephalic astrocyte-derived neurotrophic factor homolog n=1 Tax=Albugo laibachii Nc14 TaxID=890382 RepID=F0VZ43_9STRA|nr:SSP4 [Albugo laibachii Nc14]|eukprot:CCA14058.1 SSP4 [Albugo laibachii Nc14]
MQDRLYAVSFTILTSRHRMQISSLSLLIVLAFAAVQGRTVEQPKESSVNPDDLNASPCPVCVKVIGDVKTLYATKKYKKPEEALMHYCGKVVKVGTKEDKVCDNLKAMKMDVGVQVGFGKEAVRICEKFSGTNSDVCTIRYDVKVNEDTDFTKLRVKQLKAILNGRGVQCVGCVEKDEFIKKIRETQHMEL